MDVINRVSSQISPPSLPGGLRPVTNSVTGGAAVQVALGGPTIAKCFMTFCAVTTDVFVAFKKGTSAASVTVNTGYLIPAGQERAWFIDPREVDFVEHITAGVAGRLEWYRSSPLVEGTT